MVGAISSTGTQTLYKNGDLVGTSSGSVLTSEYRVNHYIGHSNWAADSNFNGYIAYVRLYNGLALSAIDAAALYSRRFDCKAGMCSCGGSCTNSTDGFNSTSNSLKCAAGFYSTLNSSKCTKCPIGYFSTAGASSCTSCPTGTYTYSNGSISCPIVYSAPSTYEMSWEACVNTCNALSGRTIANFYNSGENDAAARFIILTKFFL